MAFPKTLNGRKWLRLVCFALAALLPFILALSALFFLPKAYSETFLGELAAKYRLMKKT